MKKWMGTLRRQFASYRYNSLFIRSFRLIFLGVALPLMVLSVAIYGFSQDSLRREMEVANLRSLDLVESIAGTVVSETQTLALQLGLDEEVLAALRSPLPQSYAEFERVLRVMDKLEFSRKTAFVDSIYLYNLKNGYLITNKGYSSRLDSMAKNDVQSVLGRLFPTGTAWLTQEIRPVFLSDSTPVPVITFLRRTNATGALGVVAIHVGEQTLRQLLGGVRERVEGTSALIGEDGAVLFESTGSFRGKTVVDMLGDGAEQLRVGERGTFSMVFAGEQAMVSYGRLPGSGWVCLQIVPFRAYAGSLMALRAFVLLVLSLGLLISGGIALALSARLYRPIREIIAFIDGLPQGGQTQADNELSHILMHLLSLYDENKMLEQEKLGRFSALREAQAHTLQAQITPHFLHNTLQAVQWQVLRATGRDDEPALTALVMLAELARDTMEDTGNLTTLAREVAYVDRYMALQKLRYQDALTYTKAVPEELMQAVVPRICLQPLVENAVEHALGGRAGHIHLFGEVQGEHLVLGVMDDGVGMPAAQMDAYNQSFAQEGEAFIRHIGLGNVNQRVRLLFGDAYGLSLETSPWGGLTAKFLLPLKFEEQ